MPLGITHLLVDTLQPRRGSTGYAPEPNAPRRRPQQSYTPNPLKWLIHSSAIVTGQFILSQCIKSQVLNKHRAKLNAPFIIACTHISHLEPFIVSCMLNRKIDWMARIEFFRHPIVAQLLQHADAFSVNRQGVPVSSIRTSIERLKKKRIVGIFPEGGLVRGKEAAVRGGIIKEGACLVACRAEVPILPIVVLGTEKLNCVDPWLPMRRGNLWINIGRPVQPVCCDASRRATRKAMSMELQKRFVSTYQELLEAAWLDDADVP